MKRGLRFLKTISSQKSTTSAKTNTPWLALSTKDASPAFCQECSRHLSTSAWSATRSSTSPTSSRSRKKTRRSSTAAMATVMPADLANLGNRANPGKPLALGWNPLPTLLLQNPLRPVRSAARIVLRRAETVASRVATVVVKADAAGMAAAAVASGVADLAERSAHSIHRRWLKRPPRPSRYRCPSAEPQAAFPRRIFPLCYPESLSRSTAVHALNRALPQPRLPVVVHGQPAAVPGLLPSWTCLRDGTVVRFCRVKLYPGTGAQIPETDSPRKPEQQLPSPRSKNRGMQLTNRSRRSRRLSRSKLLRRRSLRLRW